jgi:hypothetical protein
MDLEEKISIYQKELLDTPDLSEEYIRAHHDKVNWPLLSRFKNFTPEFLRDFKHEIDWTDYTYANILANMFSLELIREFQNEVDWCVVSQHFQMPEAFILEFGDQVNWYFISGHQKVTEKMIEKYEKLLDWDRITSAQRMTDEFVRKYKHKINWPCYFKENFASFSIMKEFILKTDFVSIDEFESSDLNEYEKKEIQKLLDLKNTFKIKKTY